MNIQELERKIGFELEVPRNRRIKNKVFVFGKTAYMVMRNMQREAVGVCILDGKNVKKVSKYKWCLTKKGYVITDHKKDGRIWMHHLILPKQGLLLTDHKNHNKADNRESNLRRATPFQNTVNRSGVVGVCFDSYRSKYNPNGKNWVARVRVGRKWGYQEYFKTREEAILSRKIKAEEIFGEFAPK